MPVSVAVLLDAGSDPIRGTLDDGAGPPIEFSGWLELMSGFETVCERATEPDQPEAPSGP